MFVNVRVKILPHADKDFLPHYATEHAAGLDLRAAIPGGNPVPLLPGERVLVPTGIAIELPAGYEAQVRPRSGLAIKHGVGLLNSPGTIDADYRGEIKVIMQNFGQAAFTVERGMRIAQMVIARYQRIAWKIVDELGDTDRGDGGFGHSGLN